MRVSVFHQLASRTENAVAAMTDRPQMLVEEFEDIARHAPETVRLEFVHGKLGVKAASDGDHSEIIRWITERCMQLRPDLGLYPERGLKVEAYREGRARPDGTLAPKGTFAGHGEWSDAGQVLMVVEVTSYDSDTDHCDRVEKPRAYAQTAIPVYLLVDRNTCETFVFSKPEHGVYTSIARLPFGKTVELPAPVGITLDTEALKAWVH